MEEDGEDKLKDKDMRKILIVILISLLPCFCSAQVVNEICGVKFGSTYAQAKEILERRFGEADATYSTQETLFFTDKTYAGVFFDGLLFQFQAGVFNKCVLGVYCKDATDAKNQRDYIAQKLSEKYELYHEIGSDKFKYYVGGTSPVDENEYGFMLHVNNVDGQWMAMLLYGPYNIVNEEF